MYEIYAYPFGNPDAKLLLYRPNDPQALVLSPKLTREVSKGGSLVFTMTRDHAQYDMLQKLSTVVQVRRDGKEIWRGRVLKHEADFYNRRVVYCEGALSYFNDSSITPFNYKGTLRQFLQHLIDAHNDQVKSKMKCFQLGTVTAALATLWCSSAMPTSTALARTTAKCGTFWTSWCSKCSAGIFIAALMRLPATTC